MGRRCLRTTACSAAAARQRPVHIARRARPTVCRRGASEVVQQLGEPRAGAAPRVGRVDLLSSSDHVYGCGMNTARSPAARAGEDVRARRVADHPGPSGVEALLRDQLAVGRGVLLRPRCACSGSGAPAPRRRSCVAVRRVWPLVSSSRSCRVASCGERVRDAGHQLHLVVDQRRGELGDLGALGVGRRPTSRAARSRRAGCAGSSRCRSRVRRWWPARRRRAPRAGPRGRGWGGRAIRGSRAPRARTARCSPTACRRRRRRGSGAARGETLGGRSDRRFGFGPGNCRCPVVACPSWTPPRASPTRSTSTTRGSATRSVATAGPCRPCWATRSRRRWSTRSGWRASGTRS